MFNMRNRLAFALQKIPLLPLFTIKQKREPSAPAKGRRSWGNCRWHGPTYDSVEHKNKVEDHKRRMRNIAKASRLRNRAA